MNTLEIENELIEPVHAICTDEELQVTLSDGAKIVVPLWWYPRLLKATPEERKRVEFSPFGLHWEEIDEDLSVEGLLKGWKAPGAKPPAEAAE